MGKNLNARMSATARARCDLYRPPRGLLEDSPSPIPPSPGGLAQAELDNQA